MIVSLGELAAIPGLPSEPTLRKLIEQNADFPVISRGKNGQSYEFDLEATIAFIKDLRRREEDEARARSEEVRQLGLQLLGDDALAASERTVGLSPTERKAMLEEELLATKLAVQRGELVRKLETEAAIAQFVLLVADKQVTFSARLAKRADISRDLIAVIDRMIEADRRDIAAAMERMSNVAPASEGDPAL
jgi:hypothetical protein